VFGVCVFRHNSITAEPCFVHCVSGLQQTKCFVVVTKQLTSVLPHWSATRDSKSKQNTMACLHAFLYSLYRIFSLSAATGPSLTSSIYLSIPSSKIGIGRRKKYRVFQTLIPSWRIVATFIVLKTPVTGKYGWQNLELVASSNHFVCLRDKERYIIRW